MKESSRTDHTDTTKTMKRRGLPRNPLKLKKMQGRTIGATRRLHLFQGAIQFIRVPQCTLYIVRIDTSLKREV
jgi:hypothetical protein